MHDDNDDNYNLECNDVGPEDINNAVTMVIMIAMMMTIIILITVIVIAIIII